MCEAKTNLQAALVIMHVPVFYTHYIGKLATVLYTGNGSRVGQLFYTTVHSTEMDQ